MALTDEASTREYSYIDIYLDGTQCQKVKLEAYKTPKKVELSVKDKMRLTITTESYNGGMSANHVAILNPRLFVGSGPTGPGTNPPPPDSGPTYSIPVNPKDVAELMKSVAAKLKTDPAFSKEHCATIAMAKFKLIPVDDTKKLANVVADKVREFATNALADDGSFQLVERDQIDKAKLSMKPDNSGAVDSKTAKELGRLISADYILVGSVSDEGTYAVISARLEEVATGKMKAPASQTMQR